MLSLPAAIAVEVRTVGPSHTPKKKEKKSLFTVLPFHQGVLTDCLTEGSSDGCIIVELQFYSGDLCAQVSLIF